MFHLHANIYAQPAETAIGTMIQLRGQSLPTLAGPAGGPPRFLTTLPVTFEQAQARLAELPRCDLEPDGFFLLTGGAGQTFWRLNGHLHEFEGKLHRIELNGECPAESLDTVLQAFGWPGIELVFELVMEGVTLGEKAFRTWAASHSAPGIEDA